MTQEYIGTKQVTAWPQEKDGREGYAVKYADGYTSWSPKDVFEAAYLPLGHIQNLPQHVQRMVGELAQLNDKIEKLNTFLEGERFNALPEDDHSLLKTQGSAMVAYANALTVRVERAGA